MNLLGMLRKFGDRVGIIELAPEARLDAPVKIQTRAVTLSELATKIQITGVGKLAELPAELSVSFEDIYRAAGIHATSTGWTVERLYEFLNSDAIRAMDRPTAQQEALRVLAAEKVDAADLIKDAVARDQALDAYQDFMARKREPRIRALEDQRKRLEQEIAAEEESWREWRRRKRAREHEMVMSTVQ
ncbi:MAG: hypothetical protein AUG12_00545 [Acidobacteria bacterium 13_1_20CM_2_57_8]|nr:MAG: hypothetical protein AUG12_00545 [Acidobacteria bacterium 13_1_20CM_2_57_8]